MAVIGAEPVKVREQDADQAYGLTVQKIDTGTAGNIHARRRCLAGFQTDS
jgi:hypothetical protein